MVRGFTIIMLTKSTQWRLTTMLAVFPLPSPMKACKTIALASKKVVAETTMV